MLNGLIVQNKESYYGYFEWIDPPMCARSVVVIPELHNEIQNLRRKNTNLLASTCQTEDKEANRLHEFASELFQKLEKSKARHGRFRKMALVALFLSWVVIFLILNVSCNRDVVMLV